tara:strand:- start:651 stop:878 length:228 start_codon:yes stop_codon:yes gene_type:complete
MRVTVEETDKDTENKRTTTVECESDKVNVQETLDMILRGLLAYGYSMKDISLGLQALVAPPVKSDEEKPSDLGDI